MKMEVCVLANFSKTAERNKTPLTGIQVRLKLSSFQQTNQKSVSLYEEIFQHKGTVPNVKIDQYGSCFAKISPSGLHKTAYEIYMGDSPLTEDFKTPNFHNIVQSFKVSLVSTGHPWCQPLLGLKSRARFTG